MGRANSGANASKEVIALRRVKAMELRVAGKKSIREVATELGVSVATVWRDLDALLREELDGVQDLIKIHRNVELERLDQWQAKCLIALDHARDIDEQAKMINVLTSISARRAKLLGLDAPIKQEIDHTIGTAPQTAAAARAMMQSMFSTSQDRGLGPREDDEPN